MTEVEKIEKLVAQYKRGLMTREEFWTFLMVVWTETTPAPPPNRMPWRR